MDMEMEVVESLVERLAAAATLVEQAAQRLDTRDLTLQAAVAQREAELETLLAEANATIATLKAARKTHPTGISTLAARDGSPVDATTLDAALTSLSMEQRFAVKAQLLRSGLLG